jgi:hypothetical protein
MKSAVKRQSASTVTAAAALLISARSTYTVSSLGKPLLPRVCDQLDSHPVRIVEERVADWARLRGA